MKVVKGVRPLCEHCRVIRRDGKVLLVHRGERKCVSRA